MNTTNGTTGAASAAPVIARVASANDHGIKLLGRDGWLNFSKWPEPIEPPVRGQLVAITPDKSGFIRRVEAVSQDAAQASPAGCETASIPGKDTLIIRQTCIKAAAEFCASRPDLKSAELLALAERLEAWVTP